MSEKLTLLTAFCVKQRGAGQVHPMPQTPLPKSSWLITTAGLRSRPQDFDVHCPLENDKNQAATFTQCEQCKVSKTRHYSMIKSSISLKIIEKTDVDSRKYIFMFTYLLH